VKRLLAFSKFSLLTLNEKWSIRVFLISVSIMLLLEFEGNNAMPYLLASIKIGESPHSGN
jgi:hypothetical protein